VGWQQQRRQWQQAAGKCIDSRACFKGAEACASLHMPNMILLNDND
jgi:hypothetical protein